VKRIKLWEAYMGVMFFFIGGVAPAKPDPLRLQTSG
jgi:hypothetical protein